MYYKWEQIKIYVGTFCWSYEEVQIHFKLVHDLAETMRWCE